MARRDVIRGTIRKTLTQACLITLLALPLAAQSVDRLSAHNVAIAQADYKGRKAIRITAASDAANATTYAAIKDVSFRDGTIEVDLAGMPAAGAGADARGFIGVAFRIQENGSYEYIYLRPTNGRADDQVRRNHSTQYSSYPDFGFARSRQEAMKSMNRMSTWSQVYGPSSRLRWRAAKRGSTFTA
jgi:hypothetical protein